MPGVPQSARGRHLVGEWLEEVEIASIDEREVDRRSGKVLCRLEPAEPAAYDDDPMPLSWRATVRVHDDRPRGPGGVVSAKS
jgi:hypothetical protein